MAFPSSDSPGFSTAVVLSWFCFRPQILDIEWMSSTVDIKWWPNALPKLFIIQNWIWIGSCSQQPNNYLHFFFFFFNPIVLVGSWFSRMRACQATCSCWHEPYLLASTQWQIHFHKNTVEFDWMCDLWKQQKKYGKHFLLPFKGR